MNLPITIQNQEGEHLDYSFVEGSRDAYLVVLSHGVTGEKDRPLLVHLFEKLVSDGWPALRFSFSGNGKSAGRFEDSTISKEVEDLNCVLAAIGKDRKIIYIGHSMGGAVGVKAGAGGLHLSGLVSLAGMVFTKQFCETEFGSEIPGEGCMWGEEEFPLSQAFVNDLNEIGDLLVSAAEIDVPWLLIHGSEDDVVPLDDSKSALNASTSQNVELQIINGADHLFVDHLEPMSKIVVEWLNNTFLSDDSR